MAIVSFALKLDENSEQTGETTLADLARTSATVQFKCTNISTGSTNELNLITCRNGVSTSHVVTPTVTAGSATYNMSAGMVATIYQDAQGGDWDYVEARWTLGGVNTPATSVMFTEVNGTPYDLSSWPPKPKK